MGQQEERPRNVCQLCGRLLPRSATSNTCSRCKNDLLFHEVKEFIRANDVTEFQVAEQFHIPLSRVRGWIKEGRIEYKQNGPQIS